MQSEFPTEFPTTVIALDIGGTKIAGALVTYEIRRATPDIEYRIHMPTCAQEGGDCVLNRVVAAAQELRDEAQRRGCRVCGVGVSTAGSVDTHTGMIAYANQIMPGWQGQPVGARLAKELGVASAVLNDVHAHALGEVRHGSAQGVQHAVVAAVGTGVGGAVILNGEVFTGAHGYAGYLGHTTSSLAKGCMCACGIEGHLEAIASGSGIEAAYLRATKESASGSQITERAYAGDQVARQIIERAGRSLGESIADWAAVIDPELCIISGSVMAAGTLWRTALDAGVASRLTDEFKGLPIVEAALGADAPLIGAAERLLDTLG